MTIYVDTHTHATAIADGVETETTTYLRTYCDTDVHVDMQTLRYGLWIQSGQYDTKAETDTIIAFCIAHGITDIYPLSMWDNTPHVMMGNSTLGNVTTTTVEGVTPITYLCAQANANGIKVHAWFVIMYWGYWGGADSVLITPLVDNATNHDTSNGGSCLNYAQTVPRGVVEDLITDFYDENAGLSGISLDYIRTDGIVTGQADADITAFVSELRAKIPTAELSFCSFSDIALAARVHQDGATWIANDYVDTTLSMAYNFAYAVRKKYWDTCNHVGKSHLVGQQIVSTNTTISDFKAGLIRYRDNGVTSFAIFDWTGMRLTGYDDAWYAYLDGTIDAITTQLGISKITVIPETSFSITIDGTPYTTANADVADHTTTGALKTHVETVIGFEQPAIRYNRPTATTIVIVVGDFEP